MSLTNPEMARLGELLDEALPLTPEQRYIWLDSLSSEDQPLVRTLRDALLAEEPGAGGPLDRPPRIGTGGVEEEGAAGRHAGERLGAYELLRPLGSGGMADVWLACRTDGAFERQVALKIPRLQSRPLEMTARFALECNILASLEYPGIARLYDAGLDASGVPYIAMEYVQGEPLVAWCDARGLDKAARIQLFLQVLEVVAYAHGRQVIHRDLKPSNIMVTGQGEVRLLDFGLARLLQPEADSALLTRAYGLAVTPEYASPEMLRGESIDSRSDIYSLGVVLHELLTGARPGQPTRPASGDTTRLHGAMREVVTRALQPDPGDRYPDAASFAAALRPFVDGRAHELSGRWKIRPLWVAGLAALAALGGMAALRGGIFWPYDRANERATAIAKNADATMASPSVVADTRPSIAVLPFENRSWLEDDAFFVDGIHDDILMQLTKVGALKVIARTSVQQFRDTKLTTKEIGEKLGVTKVLEGGVQRAGDRVRVNVQLIDAATDAHLWAESYDRELTAANIFAIQSEVAVDIAGALKATLTPGEQALVNAIPTQSLEAWQAYQLGKQRMARRTRAMLTEAEGHFRKAIALDPKFALAWTALADTLVLRIGDSGEAEQALTRALELNPNLAEAWASAGLLAINRQQHERAEQMLRRAIALNPNYAPAHQWLAGPLIALGRRDEALAQAERAVALDPLSGIINNTLGQARVNVGRFDDALVAFRQAIEIDSTFPYPYGQIGNVHAMVFGRFDAAVPWYEKAAGIDPGNPVFTFLLAATKWHLGDDGEAERWLARSLANGGEGIPGTHLLAAFLSLQRGDAASARRHGQRAADLDPRNIVLMRDDDLRRGDYATARARYAKAFPKLFAKDLSGLTPFDAFAAIELALVLQHTGEGEHARALLDYSEAYLRAIPRMGGNGFRINDVAIHALRGDTVKALAKLREAEQVGWRVEWRYHRDFDPMLASIRNEPVFEAVFADIERDMAQQRARLAARPKDAPLDLAVSGSR
jgi:TolB-like protein/Flp pilus assembly protein TadD/tRNA A-37 threonylcarbamoyl transferase component Bud32